ncbi:MAG: zf-HC2 domain-containing protein [Gemmatimonadetes bacterium]|nr:zf-HC2 domain-containing protein [Gemmatimonadota bacterium]
MPRPDERPDDGLIHAWLDGELGAEEAARVERLVAEDAEWAAAAAEARGLMAASTRILGALDVVAGDVIPRGGSAAGTFAPTVDGSRAPTARVTRWAVPTWMRVAAGVALVAGVGYLGIERTADRSSVASAPGATLDGARETRAEVADAISRDAVEPVAKQAESGVAPSSAQATVPSATGGAPATPERSARQSAQATRTESDLSARDARRAAPVAAAVAAPTSTAPVTTPPVTGETGVAGGIASGAVSRSAAESKEMLTTAGVATEREARAKTMQRALAQTPSAPLGRALDSPSATAAPGALMADRLAENVVTRTSVSGCWRAETAAKVDSIQVSPRIVRSVGDTLVLALTPTGAEARVVRESDTTLRGSARGVTGPSATFRADRTACTP